MIGGSTSLRGKRSSFIPVQGQSLFRLRLTSTSFESFKKSYELVPHSLNMDLLNSFSSLTKEAQEELISSLQRRVDNQKEEDVCQLADNSADDSLEPVSKGKALSHPQGRFKVGPN